MKKLLSILTFLFVTYNYGQTFSQTFVDRCTGEVQVVTANFSNGSAVVAFYDEVKLFTYTEFTNGTLQSWLVAKYNWWQALSPCSQAQQQTQTAQNAANNASNAASNASNATNNATQNTGTTNTGSTNTGGTTSGSSGSTSSGSTSSGSSSSGSSSSGSSSGGSTEGSNGGNSSSGGDSGSSSGDSGSSSGGDSGSGSDSSGGDSGGSSDSGGGDNSSDNNSGDNSGDSSDNGNSSEDNNNNTEGDNNGESEGQGDSDGSEGSSEESDTEGSGEDSSEESSETDSEESGEGSEESDSEDSESDEVEEEKKEEESEEKSEEESEEESEESEEESDEEESDEEESEEESEDDSEEEEEEEEKERRMMPIQLRADVMQQQALTLEYNSVLNIGASQSSIYGDRSYNLNGMIWDNLKQFGLSFSTSTVSLTSDYQVAWVDGVNVSYMRNYNMNAISFGANRMKPMGKWGTVGIGINYAYMFGKDALGDKIPDMYSLGYNFLYTNSFQLSPRINYAPAFIVAQNPLTVQEGTEWKTSAITNNDVMGILSNSFTVQFTKRFSLNLGWTVIASTNEFLPIMNSFMVGSKIPF